MGAPVLLQQVESNGRRFVLRRCSQGMFPFEVSEVTKDNHFVDHSSYRLRSLAERELESRVAWAKSGWHSMDAITAHLREKHGPIHERPLSAADQYRAENPLLPSCMPDHHS